MSHREAKQATSVRSRFFFRSPRQFMPKEKIARDIICRMERAQVSGPRPTTASSNLGRVFAGLAYLQTCRTAGMYLPSPSSPQSIAHGSSGAEETGRSLTYGKSKRPWRGSGAPHSGSSRRKWRRFEEPLGDPPIPAQISRCQGCCTHGYRTSPIWPRSDDLGDRSVGATIAHDRLPTCHDAPRSEHLLTSQTNYWGSSKQCGVGSQPAVRDTPFPIVQGHDLVVASRKPRRASDTDCEVDPLTLLLPVRAGRSLPWASEKRTYSGQKHFATSRLWPYFVARVLPLFDPELCLVEKI